MKPPLINLEEKIDRVVGRTGPVDGLSLAGRNQADAVAWSKAFGSIPIPRGVYRFKTHEQADEWLWKMITRPSPK